MRAGPEASAPAPGAASALASPEPDGRVRIDVSEHGAKRIAYVSAEEHAALVATLARTDRILRILR